MVELGPSCIVDSDVVIWHLRRRDATTALLEKLAEEGPLGCSVLTISEVMRVVRTDEMKRTRILLDSLVAVSVGRREAELAASLMRDRGPGFVDCHIAATALLRDLPMVTYNLRDYERTGVKLFDTSAW